MQSPASLVKMDASMTTIFPPGKTCLFLAGAGVSMDPPTNLPSARAIVKALTEYCVRPEDAPALFAAKLFRYEQLVEAIQRTMDDELKFLNYFDLVAEPNEIHRFLAAAILQGHDVVTTNFDYSIEQALQQLVPPAQQANLVPVITMGDYEQLKDPNALHAQGKWPLYKIHGSKKNFVTQVNTEASLVTTISALSQYKAGGEVFGLEAFKRPVIEALAKDRVLVIMGYSGSDDFDISPFLKKMQGVSRIVWIDHVVDPNAAPLAFRVERADTGVARQELSHVDKLLFDIKANGPNPNIEIVKVVANTGTFIKQVAWAVLKTTGASVPQLKPRDPSKSARPPFKEWCAPFYANVNELDKLLIAYLLFNQLQMNDAKTRCIDAGLASATRQGNKRFMFAFTNFKATSALASARLPEARALFESALVIAREDKNPIGRGAVLLNLGMVWQAEGNIDKAMECYRAALAANDDVSTLLKAKLGAETEGKSRALNDLTSQNQRFIMNLTGFDTNFRYLTSRNVILNNIGTLYLARGDISQALQSFKDAMVVDEQLGDMYGKAKTLMNIGKIFARTKMYSEAWAKLTETLNVNQQLANQDGISEVHGELGSLCYATGDYYRAIEYYERALAKQVECDNKVAMAWTWNSFADVYRDLYKKTLAQTCLAKALAIRKELNNQVGVGSVLMNEGKVHLMWGDYAAALAKVQEATALYAAINNKDGSLQSYALLGYVYQRMKQYPDAIKCYEKVIAIAKETNRISFVAEYQAAIAKAERLRTTAMEPPHPTREESQVLFDKGCQAYRQGNAIGAFAEFKAGLQVALALQDLPGAANFFFLLAQVAEYSGRYDDAIDYALQSTVLHDNLQKHEDMAILVKFTAEVYEKRQELLRAAAYYLRAVEIYDMLGTPQKNVDLLRKVFQIYSDLGQPERALPYLEKMHGIAKAVNYAESMLDAVSWLAFVSLSRGDYPGAEKWFKEGMTVAEGAQIFDAYYGGLLNVGTCQEIQGNLARALDWYSQGRAYAQSHGLDATGSEGLIDMMKQSLQKADSLRAASVPPLEALLEEGVKDSQQQHPDQAKVCFLAGLSLAVAQESPLVPQFLYQIGVVSQPEGVIALNYLDAASFRAKLIGNLAIQADCARLSGQIHVSSKEWAHAGAQFEKAARLHERQQNYTAQAQALFSLGKVQGEGAGYARAFYFEAAGDAYDLGRDSRAAIQTYVDAAGVYKEISFPRMTATCLAKAGHVALATGNIPVATQHLTEAIAVDPALGEALYDLARIFARQGQNTPAIDKLRQAVGTDVKFAFSAKKEPDFQSLLATPEYKMLVK